MKNLVVDDDPTNLLMLQEFLGAEGHAFVTAQDGLEALTLLHQTSYDVVMTDWMMPRCDGLS